VRLLPKTLGSTHQIRRGQRPVVQAGSELPDHVHDLVVGDGRVHLLTAEKNTQERRIQRWRRGEEERMCECRV